MAMTAKGFITGLSGGTEVAGTLSIAAPGALYAVDFPRPKRKNPASELLPPAAADRTVIRAQMAEYFLFSSGSILKDWSRRHDRRLSQSTPYARCFLLCCVLK